MVFIQAGNMDSGTLPKPSDENTPLKPMPVPQYSLYVGDLDSSVTENQLTEIFSKFGELESTVLCKDIITLQSLRYGFVNFKRLEEAKRAMQELNYSIINGKSIRIMWQQSNPETRNGAAGNLFVKNLDDSIDNQKLNKIFSKFGCISSCKVAVFEDGRSKGFGFVQYEDQICANYAIEELNGVTIEGKALYVTQFIKKSDRSFSNLYVKNFELDVTEESLKKLFTKFGNITSLAIAKDAQGFSRGFGFVNFENADDAKRAMETMNGTRLGSKILYVARAQKQVERKQILRIRQQHIQIIKGRNLYIKNINDHVNEDNLKAYFNQCGSIDSVKIMRTLKGVNKGFGFIVFSKVEEAIRAINTLNGTLFHGKPLYVALAQSKEERRAFLQNLYTNHGRLSTYTLPNFYPYNHTAAPLFCGWRSPFQPPMPPMPTMVAADSTRHSRMRMNGQAHNYSINPPFLRTLTYPSHQQTTMQVHNNLNGHSQDSENLSSMLAAATPDQRKVILRDRLYPLVKKLKPHGDFCSNIIELLLQMDNSELLVLLDSPESLATKVEEALLVLADTKF